MLRLDVDVVHPDANAAWPGRREQLTAVRAMRNLWVAAQQRRAAIANINCNVDLLA